MNLQEKTEACAARFLEMAEGGRTVGSGREAGIIE